MHEADVLVLGAGMAGASLAAELATDLRVIVLEIEDRAGRHATGRSAAMFAGNYGNATVRTLTQASRDFFTSPPPEFGSSPLMRPRGALFVADAGRLERLDALMSSSGSQGVSKLSARDVRRRCPILREGWVAGGVEDTDAFDLDVAAIHQGYLRRARASSKMTLVTDVGFTCLHAAAFGWKVETAKGVYRASIVVNATGAWADLVARSVGATTIGLRPLRRTCLLLPAPAVPSFDTWPMVIDADEEFYFKPESGRLLLSPANEDPSTPSDAIPDEMDVATAIDRFERATVTVVTSIGHRWAGLRSFVADRSPVVGFDPKIDGFFWFAAQGGYGIQMAPALARVAASLIRRRSPPADVAAYGFDLAAIAPDRSALTTI